MNTRARWLQILVLPLLIALAACSSGGGGGDDEDEDDNAPDPPVNVADAAGLWHGTGSVAGSPVTYAFIALVTPDGHLRMGIGSSDTSGTLAPTAIEGTLSGATGTLSLNAGHLYSFSLPNIGAVTAEFDGEPRSRMTGSVTFADKRYQLDGTYSAQYETDSSLAAIAGVYTQSTGTFTITIAIDAEGKLTGSDTRSCTYNGTVSADLPTINAYSFGWFASGCTGFGLNGFFSGRMALLETTSGGKALSFFGHSDTFPVPPYSPVR